MHEIALAREVLALLLQSAESAGARQVVSVRLRVGMLRDFEEGYFQRYFSHLAKGSIAQDARIEVEMVPICVQCIQCGREEQIEFDRMRDWRCSCCGESRGTLVSGQEMFVEDMRVL